MSSSSCGSGVSGFSVSYCGSEVDLECAIDDSYKNLQKHLNNSQCSLRQLAMLSEQDQDFEEAVKLYDMIEEDIDGMICLFRELKSVSKQVMGKPPPEKKDWYRKHNAQRKLDKINQKEQEKLDRENENLDIIDEEKS